MSAVRPVVVLLAALLTVAPTTYAGTADDPEITDPAGDAQTDFTDVTNVWFVLRDDGMVEISMGVVTAPPTPGLTPLGLAGASLTYYVLFTPYTAAGERVTADSPDYHYSYVSARFTSEPSPEFWSFAHGVAYDGDTGVTLGTRGTLEGRVDGNTLVWVLDPSIDHIGLTPGIVAGSSLREVSSYSSIVPRVVVGLIIPDDDAPDDGFGRDFTFPAPAPEPTGPLTHYVDLSEPRVIQSFPNATSDVFIYNWTNVPKDIQIDFGAELANGSLALSITDSGNTTMLEAQITQSVNLTETFRNVTTGAWQLRIEYTDFAGQFQFDVKEAPPAPKDTGGAGDGNGDNAGAGDQDTGTPTDSSEPTGSQPSTGVDEGSPDQESPGIGVAALLLVAGVGAARRRR